jgi:O-antigen ligase
MSGHENWNRMQAVRLARANDPVSDSFSDSLAPAEYGYYFVVFYTVLGPRLGLILTGNIGSGFLLIPLLALCAASLGPSLLPVMRSAWPALACGVSYLFIQLAVHEESLYGVYVYQFGPWLISLVIVHAIAMHRPDLLHRFAWFTVLLGLALLPFMSQAQAGRVALERGIGYSNANTLGALFGFCVVYMTIRGYVETRLAYRLAAWGMAVGCLYVVTLTVSRGALVAVVASIVVVGRRLWKVGFLPLLLLAGLLLGLMEMGIFDQAVDSYSRRAGEETGRLRVWPLLIQKFLNSPFIGYGASQNGEIINTGQSVSPHNGFLLFAVASGIVPLVLFCAYCFRSGMTALRTNAADRGSIYHLPLVVYTVLIISAGNLEFMEPWALVSLALPVVADVCREARERSIRSLRPGKVH